MKIEQSDGTITVTRPTERGDDRALHGLTRTLIANMVEGVTKGFEKRLELQGVGYRAALQGTDLRLDVGYSHPVVIKAPQGISFEVPTHDRGRRQGRREAAGRSDRSRDPQGAPARAVQGQGHPLPGRVRAPQGREARVMATLTVREARKRRHRRVRGQGRGHGRAAAPRRDALEPRHRRAARRRRERPHRSPRRAGCRSRSRSRATRPRRRPRSASCWHRRPRRRRSTARCSTAAATSTTDASRRWRMPRAKGD